MTDAARTGIILANTGSPSSPTPDGLELYLRRYLMDPYIRQMPRPLWWALLNAVILPRRKHASAEKYQLIWREEGSPLVVDQERLRRKIQWMCNAEGLMPAVPGGVAVRSAMSYGEPTMTSALEELRLCGCERVILLPLYPQSAYCVTGSVKASFQRVLARLTWSPPVAVVESYYENEYYLQAVAASIRAQGFEPRSDDQIILSFHAIPLKDERAGDTYCLQTRATANLVAERLYIDPARITVTYQSAFGPHPEAWASPKALDVLRAWRDESFRVFFCCPGFAVDCLETLYDIPCEMLPALEGDDVAIPPLERVIGGGALSARGRLVWIPALGPSDTHAILIRKVIDDAIARWS